jgi:hypothetical protein
MYSARRAAQVTRTMNDIGACLRCIGVTSAAY